MMFLKNFSLVASLFLLPTALAGKTRGLRSMQEASAGRLLDWEETSPPEDEEDIFLEEEDESTTIVSFFAVEYATSEGTIDGLEAAADALVTAYNSLSFEDEFDRMMEGVTILSSEISGGGSGRDLQVNFILALLEVIGSCTGCQRDSFYSNQIITRQLNAIPESSGKNEWRRQRKMSKGKSKSSKSSKKSGKKSGISKNINMIIQGLPTEEDILSSYSAEIMDSDVDFGNIVDVLSIIELEENPLGEIPERKLSAQSS